MDPFGCELVARTRLRERDADYARLGRLASLLAASCPTPSDLAHGPVRFRRFLGGLLIRAGHWIGGLDDGHIGSPAPAIRQGGG